MTKQSAWEQGLEGGAHFPVCDGCNRQCDGPEMTHFHADANVDSLDLCGACELLQRDAFVCEVMTMLGRPLTDEEVETVWDSANVEFDAEKVALRLGGVQS